jgi:hypothetical protein
MKGMHAKTILSAQVAVPQRDQLARLAAAHERSLSGKLRRAVDVYLRLTDPPLPSSAGTDASRADAASAAGVEDFSSMASSSREGGGVAAMTGAAPRFGDSSP